MSHPILPRVPPLHNRRDKKCHTLFSQGSPLCTIGGTKKVTPYSPKGPRFAQWLDKKCHTLLSQGSPLCTIRGTKNVTPYLPIRYRFCLLYTSDAADDLLCVDLGGR